MTPSAGASVVAGSAARPSRVRLIVMVVALVLAAWLALGLLRAESVARDYLIHLAGSGARVLHVEANLQPAVPPFWGVEIHGEVIEAGQTGPGYISAMILWVEPITGWVIVMGSG